MRTAGTSISADGPSHQVVDPKRSMAMAGLSRRMAYGAWYLPKEQWESRAVQAGRSSLPYGYSKKERRAGRGLPACGSSSDVASKSSFGQMSTQSPSGATVAADSSEDLSEQIPKLYSSRIYKDYLRAQHTNRLPHYLQRIQSPKLNISSR